MTTNKEINDRIRAALGYKTEQPEQAPDAKSGAGMSQDQPNQHRHAEINNAIIRAARGVGSNDKLFKAGKQ